MSITFYFIKPATIPLKEIAQKTSIKVIEENGSFWLEKDGQSVLAYASSIEDELGAVKRFHGNDPAEIFKELVLAFDLYFVSEYAYAETFYDPNFLTDKFLEKYRSSLWEETKV